MKRILGLVLIALVASGCAAPAYGVTGTVLVRPKLLSYHAPDEGEACTVADSLSDVGAGTTVTIRDGGGTIVGMGQLGSPTVTYPGEVGIGKHKCELTFTIDKVPSGKGYYSVEVGSRGQVEFSEDRLFGGPSLTLG